MSTLEILGLTLGCIASVLTIIGWFPQAIKTFRTKDTSGISLGFYGLVYVSTIIWLVYAIIFVANQGAGWYSSIPVLVTNAFALALNTIILLIKFRNMTQAKKENLTEREYISKKYYKPNKTDN